MNKLYKKIIIFFITILIGVCINCVESQAANASISASSQKVNVGDKVTISASATGCLSELTVSGPGVSGRIDIVNTNLENETKSATYTLDTSSAGTKTVTITGSVVDADKTEVPISKSVTITVSEKANQPANNNNNSNNNNNNTNQNNQPTQTQQPAATYTNTNQTLYIKNNDTNVRKEAVNGTVITSLKAGTSVQVTGTGSNGWSRVNINGQTGYIRSDLLTATKPEEKKEEEKEEENKEKSTNKALKDLVVENYKLTPEFSPEVTKYSVTVDNTVDKLEISAITQDEKAEAVITKNEDFKIGENVVYITVTAEDKTTRIYTIAVTKTKEGAETTDKLRLKKLEVDNASLDPSFDADKTNYTITVSDPASLKKEDIIALAEDEDAEVKIALSDVDGNDERLITIMVEKGEGDTKQSGTYQITVKKAAFNPVAELAKNKDNKIYYILGAIIGVLLIFIIIIIILLKKTSNTDDYDIQDEDELDDNYDYSLKNAIDEAKNETAEEMNPEYDEIVENSNIKSQILNPTEYNVFDDQGDGVGAPEETRRYNFNDDDDFDPKPKKKGKHF